MIKVGVVGAGFTGQQHVEAIRRVPGLRVVALSDSNPRLLTEKGDSLDIQARFADCRQMLDACELDVIHNCTPNACHSAVNRMALEKGLHVFCEKPLAVETNEAWELTELAGSRGLAAGVNFNYRSNAMVQEMHQRIAQGEAGRLFLVHGHYIQDWLMRDTDYNWRLEESVGGKSRATADIGSHWFDLLQFVTGRRVVRVFAQFFTVYQTRYRARDQGETFAKSTGENLVPVPVHSEDGGMIIAQLEDGIFANLVLSQVSGGYNNALDICVSGEAFSMSWAQELPDRLMVGTPGRWETIACAPGVLHSGAQRYATLPAGHVTAWSDALRNNVREFYDSIKRGDFDREEQSYATFRDAAAIMEIVEACRESSRTASWVSVRR